MLKKLNPACKQNILIAVALFVILLAKYIHSVAIFGLEIRYLAVITVGLVLYCLIISFAFDNEIFTLKNILIVLSAVSVILGVLSTENIGIEKLAGLTTAMAGILLAKNFKTVLLPAALSVLTVCFFEYAAIQSIPVYFAVSAVCLLPKFLEASLIEKIIFAISEIVMAGCSVVTFYNHRYSVAYSSLRGTWKSALLLVILAALLVFFAVKSIMGNKSRLEIIGYTFMLLVCIFCIGMGKAHILLAVATVAVALVILMQNETVAKNSSEVLVEAVSNKIKK